MGNVSKTDGGADVSQFAAEVVARLVKREGDTVPEMRESLVQSLMRAVCSVDPQVLETLRPELRRARVSPAVLADHYIPEVARRLGREWSADCVSFAQVTMGTARLQSILREIGQGWFADAGGQSDGPTLLLVLPQGEHHTLGAMVLAGRLRRNGVSVALRIGETAQEVAAFIQGRHFDGALISVASYDRLETCRKLVKTLKDATKGALRIALGGAVLDEGGETVICAGVDVVTNDIETALAVLGLLAPAGGESETV
ncbi:cobalamin B12-binding domain-containing protein [Paragemmobacter straminiformis]|uniref:Cobalamin B12-binding domain-containing protein n=1 Tax=Paragemmobacter straminiformis TaxID=2045119 RepID=A0A842IAK1_9RHOB|nr:cobalamin-dependent protein [Gemmobacter straminiformis]MBC2836619.1 cobalamin B12-binding domain-containing protein [Gemmobacter straminiformis]